MSQGHSSRVNLDDHCSRNFGAHVPCQFCTNDNRTREIRASAKMRTYAAELLRGPRSYTRQARDPRKPQKARRSGLFGDRPRRVWRFSA